MFSVGSSKPHYTHKGRGGYHRVSLCKGGKQRTILLHRLVAVAFILNPDSLPEVNHKDGNKDHNSDTNLEWVTRQQNIEHSHSKHYELTHSSGVACHVHNLSRFCRENGLVMRCLHRVMSGQQPEHKGWRVALIGKNRE